MEHTYPDGRRFRRIPYTGLIDFLLQLVRLRHQQIERIDIEREKRDRENSPDWEEQKRFWADYRRRYAPSAKADK